MFFWPVHIFFPGFGGEASRQIEDLQPSTNLRFVKERIYVQFLNKKLLRVFGGEASLPPNP